LSFINQWRRTSHRQALKLRREGLRDMDREVEILQQFQWLNRTDAHGPVT
jgi:hypothetical protein